MSRTCQRYTTLKEICTFLDRKARSITHMRAEEVDRACVKRNGERVKPFSPHKSSSRSGSSVQGRASGSATKNVAPCRGCRGDHPLYRCPEFLALNLAGRKQAVSKWQLCHNCLRENHTADKCYSGPCVRCPNGQKHNSVLCPQRENNAQSALALAGQEGASPRKRIKKENRNPK